MKLAQRAAAAAASLLKQQQRRSTRIMQLMLRLRVKQVVFNGLLLLTGYVVGWIAMHQLRTGHLSFTPWPCGHQRDRRFDVPYVDVVTEMSPKIDNTLMIGVMTTRANLATRASAIYYTWGRDISGLIVFYIGQGKNSSSRDDKGRVGDSDKADLKYLSPTQSTVDVRSQALDHREPIRLINNLPVVELQGVSDEGYPPRDKCFAMISHMYRNYGASFQWFVRADDDVYIRNDKLVKHLQSIDSSWLWYIGQPGIGIPTERGRLGLDPGKPYCMGGPGVVFSPVSLRLLVPHFHECANSTVTAHEDTELGRCVLQHLNISCTSERSMRALFYQDYDKDSYAGHVSKALFNALTLHPVKDPRVMYKLHVVFQTQKLKDLQAYEQKLVSEMKEANKALKDEPVSFKKRGQKKEMMKEEEEESSASRFSYNRHQNVADLMDRTLGHHDEEQPQVSPAKNWLEWFLGQSRGEKAGFSALINRGASLTTQQKESIKREVLQEDNPVWSYALFKNQVCVVESTRTHRSQYTVMKRAMDELIEFKKAYESSVLKPRRIRGAYQSLTLTHGLQHLVAVSHSEGYQSFLLSSKFVGLQMREEEENTHLVSTIDNDGKRRRTQTFEATSLNKKFDADFQDYSTFNVEKAGARDSFSESAAHRRYINRDTYPRNHKGVFTSPWPQLTILLPLTGRHQTYLRFLEHLGAAASRYPASVNLRVALYPDSLGEHTLTLDASRSQTQLSVTVLERNTEEFSRSNAINAAAEGLPEDTVVFIIDVDLIVRSEFLYRVALNVKPGRAYFPIIYSKYSSESICYPRRNCTHKSFDFSRDAGFWRYYSYGILGITMRDFTKAGGLNSNIVGWGKEDVDFYERCHSNGIQVFRAPDTGLLHLYHEKSCDTSLPHDQLYMCKNSRISMYGSVAKLAEMVADIENSE